MKKAMWILAMVSLLMLSSVSAQLSVQLKRTNPGIPNVKPAELIFDVVNTDMTHQIEGFLWCMSPDDAVISSTYGAGMGSGAQYVSPIFVLDVGPSQEAMTLTVDSDTVGDKDAGCSIKWVPFRMTTKEFHDTGTGETTSEEVKEYYTMAEEYAETVADVDYRVEILDKTLPFVRPCIEEAVCPAGKVHCSWEELQCPELNIFQRFINWLRSLF